MMNTSSNDDPHSTRVAIIGTGLAGLTTAYLLQNDDKQRYSVTIFEQVRPLCYPNLTSTPPTNVSLGSYSVL